MSLTPEGTVKETGADVGDVLIGVLSDANLGLAVEISAAQLKDRGGPILGGFRILNPGKGCYADGIKSLLQEQPAFQSAPGFLLRLQQIPGCEKATHILNANALRRADEGETARVRASQVP